MESRHAFARRVRSILFTTLGLAIIASRAPAQEPDKSGPLMLSATVIEEPTRTNRIRIVWNETLLESALVLTSFRVVLTASNLTAATTFGEYDPGTFPAPGVPPTTTLTMGTANWYYRSNYFIIVNSIRDSANNVVAPNSAIAVTWSSRPPGVLPPSPNPQMTIRRVGTNGVRISWNTNSFNQALEWTTNIMRNGSASVAGPWCEVQPLMANPYFTNVQSGTHRIYRLRKTQ